MELKMHINYWKKKGNDFVMIDKKLDQLLSGESVARVVSPGISRRGHQKQDWWLPPHCVLQFKIISV